MTLHKFFQALRSLLGRYYMIVVSMLHALLMILLVLFYLSSFFTLDDEIMLIKFTSAVKNALLTSKEDEPDPDRFLFVCVSWDKQLIPKLDTATGMPVGNIDITNRDHLGKFVQTINTRPENHKYLVIDVRFYDRSDSDSLLAAELPLLKNSRVSYHKGADDKPNFPIFEAPLGLSDMQSKASDEGQMVLKYHIVQADTIHTTPLLMYEDLSGEKLVQSWPFDRIGNKLVFNSFILEHPIRWHQLFVEKKYSYVYMQDLMALAEMDPEFFHEMTKDRIIIVGDFENTDIHRTISGEIPGPIILLNAFLSIERGYNVLNWSFIAILFISFTLISYKALTINDPITRYVESKFDSAAADFLADSLFYTIYFGIVSIICYSIYNIHITILVLAFYMFGVESLIAYFHEQWEKMRHHDHKKHPKVQKPKG